MLMAGTKNPNEWILGTITVKPKRDTTNTKTQIGQNSGTTLYVGACIL